MALAPPSPPGLGHDILSVSRIANSRVLPVDPAERAVVRA